MGPGSGADVARAEAKDAENGVESEILTSLYVGKKKMECKGQVSSQLRLQT